MNNMQYVVTGMPRSGSTVTWQILDHIVRHDQPESGLLRSHGFIELEEDFIVFACYRDFRDVVLSFSNIYNMGVPQVIKHDMYRTPMNGLRQQKNEYENHPRCHFIKYEDYFPDNIPKLVAKIYHSAGLYKHLDISDSEFSGFCNLVAEKFSLENAKVISDKYKDFTRVDPKSMIHGNHITADGKIGKWKDETSPSIIGAFQTIKPDLQEFGYED